MHNYVYRYGRLYAVTVDNGASIDKAAKYGKKKDQRERRRTATDVPATAIR
uniref:Transposase n=1 Tax=Heterorhabditis bacteriophora TaxID=37862 RepID=A0A1I7WK95_HETBA